MLGAKVCPFNLGKLGKAPTCGSGGTGAGLPCSPILDTLACSRNLGQPDCAALHSLGPTEGEELSPLHHLWDEARSSGRTQTLTHHEPDPYQPPGALATKPKLDKSRPRKRLSLPGAFAQHCLALAAACPASQNLAHCHGDRERKARTGLEIATYAMRGAVAHDRGPITEASPWSCTPAL